MISCSVPAFKTGEDEMLQKNPKFWELIESAKTSAKGKYRKLERLQK